MNWKRKIKADKIYVYIFIITKNRLNYSIAKNQKCKKIFKLNVLISILIIVDSTKINMNLIQLVLLRINISINYLYLLIDHIIKYLYLLTSLIMIFFLINCWHQIQIARQINDTFYKHLTFHFVKCFMMKNDNYNRESINKS